MVKGNRPYVCPAEFACSLDNVFRKMVHKPKKILEPYVREGMSVLDLGCGPGYFTPELARLVGERGSVIAADLQPRMLEKMTWKIRRTGLEKRVKPHLCQIDKIGFSGKVDFVLAFWMVHEVQDQQRMFEELKSFLNKDGRIWVIEPIMHVTKRSFREMISRIESAGLEIVEKPKITFSRSILVSATDN